ncbi:MAG TPA: prepilin peptidase [Patescibacteria group bacterium]|nr:prepilin peptidase [Patescibacteria group bacterium]
MIVFGLIVGSFLNVVIYRLPEGRSVVRPRSYCPSCRKAIPWYENIPVASFLLLGGRCSGCGAPISPRYVIVEAAGGALAYLTVLRFGVGIHAVFVFSFLMALVAITIIDWKHRIIPDSISLPFILIGIAWSFMSPELTPLSSVLGAVAGSGGLYAVGVVYRLARHSEGMGGGDVKLMAMVGAFLGVQLVLPVVLIASFFGSLYGIALMRGGGNARTAVAFGSFLAPAAAFCTFFGTYLLSWYLQRF